MSDFRRLGSGAGIAGFVTLFVAGVPSEALEFEKERFLLEEDVQRAIERARAVRFAYENH